MIVVPTFNLQQSLERLLGMNDNQSYPHQVVYTFRAIPSIVGEWLDDEMANSMGSDIIRFG